MVAFKCCRLPTYSPKMPQVPSKPSCFKTMIAFKCCRLPTYSPKMHQVPSKPWCFKTMVAFKCCRLPTYSPKMPQVPSNSSISSPPWLLLSAVGCQPTAPKCLKFPPNPRVSRPWLLLSAVGCQPTAPKCIKFPPNPGVSRPWLLLSAVGCQPTAQPQNASSSLQLQYFKPSMVAFNCVGCQPTAPECFNPRVSRPHDVFSAVGCQPTAPKFIKFPPTLVFQDPMVAFKCCRLPTYSPKMPQVPSNPRVSRPHGSF